MYVYSFSCITGYARLNYVEFEYMGQEGYTEPGDPRFGLVYHSTGLIRPAKPSKLSHCSFHNLYSSAFGAFGTENLEMFDNVVYKSLGHCKYHNVPVLRYCCC